MDKSKNAFELGVGEGMKGGDFNARYQSAIKSMAKQQMLLGRVLKTKYTKQFGTIWKKDFSVLQQKWTNPSNVSDPSSMTGDADGPDTTTDSDNKDEEGSSSSEEEETEPKSFLDSVLTATRPRSTNGR